MVYLQNYDPKHPKHDRNFKNYGINIIFLILPIKARPYFQLGQVFVGKYMSIYEKMLSFHERILTEETNC